MRNNSKRLTRRTFLKSAGTSTAAVLMSGVPAGWAGAAYATDAPEHPDVRFGIIALTDCAAIVMAHELGYFKKFGINSIVSKEASWAVIRDKLTLGENHATHMLLGMPLASTMGLAGSPVKPMVIPWLLNRNGQAITLNNKLKAAGARTPSQIKPLAERAKAAGDPLTFAMTFPPGTHAMWLRYWLASGGINPDKDVNLITIPPPQMVANMRVDKMDGFCVGEPWNNRAIEDGIGFTAVTTQQLWKDHPEKVCAFTEEFALKNPKTVKAILKALHLASVDLDKMENRAKFAEVIARPSYINCPPSTILERLMGKYQVRRRQGGAGPVLHDLLEPQLQLPAPDLCEVVAHAVPSLGHGEGGAGLRRRQQARDAIGPVSRGHEGARRRVQSRGRAEDHVVRRRVRRERPGGVRQVVCGSQPDLVEGQRMKRVLHLLVPMVGIVLAVLVWWAASVQVPDLPSPARTWEESKVYILEPFVKRGETDQGIALLAYYSLVRVAQGFLLGAVIGTPVGFLFGVSPLLTRMFDPLMQVLRPISPLAWLPLGLVLFQKSEPAALFAIAVCSMWPTIINTMMGVRAIPQDYWNVAKVLRLSRTTTFLKIIVPATLPYMFTGYRLSLGIAWLVIVASEMLTGTPGVGGFLWQEYNSLIYAHILLAIITIGVIGFVLDRLMGLAEARLRAA